MENKKDKIKYILAIVSSMIFIVTAFNLPTETFLAAFAAGLFLIPASFFVYLVHKIAGA